jgi:hypothetical protein
VPVNNVNFIHMDDLYTILLFVAFIVYSLYKNSKKVAKKKASSPIPQHQNEPVKDIFESLFGEELTVDESPAESPKTMTYEKPYRARQSNSEISAARNAFKPVYNDINRPRTSSLKNVVHVTTKSTENYQPSIISAMLQNDGEDLRKAVIYQTILERPYI